MFPNLTRSHQEVLYEHRAVAYLMSLSPEHFMEAVCQATQRMITLASFAVLTGSRPEVHVFNDLLVQYPRKGKRKLGQVVPDNMLVLTTEPIRASTSYNVPLEPAPPFLVLEYASKSNRRKDYAEAFLMYERELKVPYCALFYTENHELALCRHNRRKYVIVKPNTHGRYPIPELGLELGILQEWMRFWYQGELLPLPANLQRELDEAQRRADEAKRRFDELQRRLEAAERELAELRGRLGKK